MKKFLSDIWMPVAGGSTALSFKGISNLSLQTPEIIDASQQLKAVTATEPLIRYFWIGVIGAIGGLLVKVLWICLKRWIPFFKNLEDEK